jgi:hypothetical protein
MRACVHVCVCVCVCVFAVLQLLVFLSVRECSCFAAASVCSMWLGATLAEHGDAVAANLQDVHVVAVPHLLRRRRRLPDHTHPPTCIEIESADWRCHMGAQIGEGGRRGHSRTMRASTVAPTVLAIRLRSNLDRTWYAHATRPLQSVSTHSAKLYHHTPIHTHTSPDLPATACPQHPHVP